MLDELAAYLAAAGIGLTVSPPTPNLFTRPFPEGGPDLAVALVTWNTTASHTFGESLSKAAHETHDFKAIARAAQGREMDAKELIEAVYGKLQRLGPVDLDGVRYMAVMGDPPRWFQTDDNKRPMYHFDARAMKAAA